MSEELSPLTDERREQLRAMLAQRKAELLELAAPLKAADPYWFYEASDGTLTDAAAAFAKKWLRPQDIPVIWQGVKNALGCTKKIVGLFGGNRAGKTIAMIIASCAKITGEVPQSLKGVFPDWRLPKKWPVYGRVYGGSTSVIEEVLVPKFKEWMPRTFWNHAGWEHTYNKQEKILRFYRRGTEFVGHIKFMSYEVEVGKTQGVDLAFAHFDEEPPQEFFEEALARFGTTNLDIGFFMTPTNGISWLYDVLIQNPGNDVGCFTVSTLTNKYISLDSLETIMDKTDSYDARKMRLLGEFVSLSGLIYSGEHKLIPDIHVIQPFKLPFDQHIVYRGMDNHLSKASYIVEEAYLSPELCHAKGLPLNSSVVVGVYFKKADTETIKADLQQRVLENKWRLGWTRYDKSLDYEQKILGDVNIIDLLKRPPNAIPAMFASEKFKGSIDAGVDEIKRGLKIDPLLKKPRRYFFDIPEVWVLVKSIQTLEREKATNEAKKGMKDAILEGKHDAHAAYRYITQGKPTFIPVEGDERYEYKPERYI